MKSEAGRMAIMEVVDMWQRCEVLVVPIHCEDPLHWTFLELGNDNGSVKDLKYYDWCRGMEKNEQLARLFLIFFEQALKPGENLTLEVPAKVNKYVQRQGSNDCGFALWSCLENAMRRRRKELDIPVYPNPVKWRQTLKTLLENCIKDQTNWLVEEIGGKQAKHPLSIPGSKTSGVKKQAALKLYPQQFYSCHSCRWSLTGEGCCYCNPMKHEKLLEKKQRLAKEVAEALKKGLLKLVEQGIIPAASIETGEAVEATEPKEGEDVD